MGRIESVTDYSAVTLNDTTLPLSTGITFLGAHPYDFTGIVVGGGCDINGDSIDEIFIHVYQNKTTYVVLGSSNHASSNVSLETFVTGIDGFKIFNEGNVKISCTSDMNNDGMDEILLSSYTFDSNRGIVYVLAGSGTLSDVTLATFISGSRGFRIFGPDGAGQFGYSLASVGKFKPGTGSGWSNSIAVGARSAVEGKGAIYIIPGIIKTSDVFIENLGPSEVLSFLGVLGDLSCGSSISGGGDFNGDGLDDLIIGCPGGNGSAYMVFGSNYTGSLYLNLLGSLEIGFKITSSSITEIGCSVAGGFDINRDGLADIALGTIANTAYIIYGKNASAFENIAIENMNTSSANPAGFALTGQPGSSFGYSVSAAGDIDGDGFGDLLIAAPHEVTTPTMTSQGAVYLLLARTPPITGIVGIDMTTFVSSETVGFKIVGDNFGKLGTSIGGAGDFNGDGLDDFIVGEPTAAVNGVGAVAGKTILWFGHSPQTMQLTVTPTATPTSVTPYTYMTVGEALPASVGATIWGANAGDRTGYTVAGGCDVNGDGIADVFLSGRLAA